IRRRHRACGQAVIGISEGNAKRRERFVTQPVDNLCPAEAHIFEALARMIRQAASVREHVGNRDVRADPGIPQRKIGNLLRNRIAPLEFTGPDFARYDRCRERLRNRRKLENRIRVDSVVRSELSHAETLRIYDLAVAYDGNCQPRYARALEYSCGDPIEGGNGGIDARRRKRDGGRKHEMEHACRLLWSRTQSLWQF